jgi:hypothetical protein
MSDDTCVVVSYYDGRPTNDLFRLLRQLRDIDAGANFNLKVIINSDSGLPLSIAEDLVGTSLEMRQNTGFNIGAWQYGWQRNPGFRFYIFLQDECEIVKSNWLLEYKKLLSKKGVGLVGESLLTWRNWAVFRELWPEAYRECVQIASRSSIILGKSPAHIQTLALGVTGECLTATQGFLLGDGKIKAIATEIMFSRRCIQNNFMVKQSAWRPFEYINHPQWSGLREAARGLKWNIARGLKQLSVF